MELILNLAWVLFAAGLIGLWLRGMRSNPAPRRLQVLALMTVVLLLLPVISLSDDLMAAQGMTESDCGVRRVLDLDQYQHPVVPAILTMPEAISAEVWIGGYTPEGLQSEGSVTSESVFTPSLNRRPPPQA